MDPIRICAASIGTFIYVAGFIGNFFSLLLFSQKELRQVSTGLLFLLLNITNTIHLLSLIVEFMDSLTLYQFFPVAAFRCQFVLWLQNLTRTVCSFLATTISIDRFIRSEYPVKSRIWCTPKNVLKLLIIYILFSVAFYGFFYHPLNIFDDAGYCSFTLNQTLYILAVNIMPPIRFTLSCVIPILVMIICGFRMLYNIERSRNRVLPQTGTQNPSLATVAIPIIRTDTTNVDHRRQNVIASDRVLLLMVVINVIAYLITQIPFNIYSVYYGYETTSDNASHLLTRSYLLMWSSIYFGVGFYLFCLASQQFRKQFLLKVKTVVLHRQPQIA